MKKKIIIAAAITIPTICAASLIYKLRKNS